MKEKIISIIAILLEDESIKEYLQEKDDLSELVLNSLNFIKLVVEIESAFDIEFEDEFLNYIEFPSLEKLCEYVEKRMKKDK